MLIASEASKTVSLRARAFRTLHGAVLEDGSILSIREGLYDGHCIHWRTVLRSFEINDDSAPCLSKGVFCLVSGENHSGDKFPIAESGIEDLMQLK